MPLCTETNHKCGTACTVNLAKGGTSAYFKDCKTGNVGTGADYDAARKAAQAKEKVLCQGLTGATLEACKKKQSTLFDPKNIERIIVPGKGKEVVREAVQREIKRGGDTGITREATPGDISNLILGSPEDWSNALKSQNCFGLPIDCVIAVIAGLAVVILIMVLF